MSELQETQEVAMVRQQVSEVLETANALSIASDDDLSAAADVLKRIKDYGKQVKERKEEITKPLNDALKSARDLFRPIEDNAEQAEKIIKGKMLVYQDAQEAARKKSEAQIAARVEKGTMKVETAVDKMAALPTVPTQARGSYGSVSTRIIKKVRIVDEAAIPRQYLVPDMGKITEAAVKGGVVIPGVEVYEEKVIASR